MTLDCNDWRLTAYALNELDDADRAEVEVAIAKSPELRSTVDEIRATVGVLQTALGQAATERRSDEATKGLQRVAQARRHHPIRRLFLPLAAAASIALAATIGWYTFTPRLARSRGVVSNSKQAGAPTTNLSPADAAKLGSLGYLGNGSKRMIGKVKNLSTDEVDALMDQLTSQDAEVQQLAMSKLTKRAEFEEGRAYSIKDGDANQSVEMYPTKFVMADELASAVKGFTEQESYSQRQQQSLSSSFTGRADGVSYGYQIPYASRDTHPREGMDNRQALAHDKGPFYAYSSESTPGDDVTRCIKFALSGQCQELAPSEPPGFEDYRPIYENPFRLVEQNPLSTFSIDVDTASYANVRRWIKGGSLPPSDAIRIEEMINYFDYAYPQPVDAHPFAVHVEVAQCPWNGEHRMARIGIKGHEIAPQDRPPANLVFLIDVSGSMQPENKLPLLREALGLMIGELHRNDTVGIVVYAGASGIVLAPTNNKDVIRSSLNGLMAGGGTNGAAGIEAAYQLAQDSFVAGGINRVILATDGDFNLGVTGSGDLQRLIEEKARSGVFLTVLGFGMGNLKDGTLETLADKGNGNYAYIDTLSEAKKVLIEQMEGTLVTIAKDVKIQVEFNPLMASAYRLIGYENRMLAAQDFNDDKKDAGEIGAGHTVTALYEIVPAGQEVNVPPVDPLKYQNVTDFSPAADSGELMTVKLRYKEPNEDVSKLIEVPVMDSGAAFAESSDDFAFAASVASFGMLLRHSEYAGSLTYGAVAEFAEGARGQDVYGYRAEFVGLVRQTQAIANVP